MASATVDMIPVTEEWYVEALGIMRNKGELQMKLDHELDMNETLRQQKEELTNDIEQLKEDICTVTRALTTTVYENKQAYSDLDRLYERYYKLKKETRRD